MRPVTMLILGDYDSEYLPHTRTREAILEAAAELHVVANTRWLSPDDLQLYPNLVAEAAGVVLAPPGPRSPRILPVPTLAGLTLIRTRDLPFLATGDSHGLVLVELAREKLGLHLAGSTRYDDDPKHAVVSMVSNSKTEGPQEPRMVDLEILDHPVVAPLYGGPRRVRELTDLTHGMSPDYAGQFQKGGLTTAAIDVHGGRPMIHVLSGQRFHVTAAFLPQLRGVRGSPHPLFRGLLDAAVRRPI